MLIKNLSQLKKALVPGVKLEIVSHNLPECIGQIRRVTKANTSGFYSVVDGKPEHRLSQGNNSLGVWCEWSSAKHWTFDAEGVCTKYFHYQYISNDILIALKILKPCDICANSGWETMGKVAACNCCEGSVFYTP
ncbi:MAG: hypothetical protein LBC56_00405 [Oscillospiraceae bacterium]|jgi:hypothetical protein|nr:hypothetical protein [Oscillospiraceae bacterium]